MTTRAGHDEATPSTVRVATYNVHGCRGNDGVLAPRRIAEVVTEIDGDVVGLQEVFSGRDACGGIDQLAMLADATGLAAIPAPTSPEAARGYGNAVLTSWTVEDVAHCDLSVGAREPRGAVETIVSRGGQRAAVVVTHLGLGRRERVRQIRKLLGWLAERPSLPRVVAGDLNEWTRWSTAWRLLARSFEGTVPIRTFPARRPVFPLDRILVGRPARIEGTAVHRSPLARIASDHLPLVVTVRLDGSVH